MENRVKSKMRLSQQTKGREKKKGDRTWLVYRHLAISSYAKTLRVRSRAFGQGGQTKVRHGEKARGNKK